jgi:hypothetical protein
MGLIAQYPYGDYGDMRLIAHLYYQQTVNSFTSMKSTRRRILFQLCMERSYAFLESNSPIQSYCYTWKCVTGSNFVCTSKC